MSKALFCCLLLSVALFPSLALAEQAGACREAGPLTVFVVRHAERQEDGSGDPGLSEAGQARALALDAVLADSRVDAIHVTQFRRTHQTAAAVLARSAAPLRQWEAEWRQVEAHAQALATAICIDASAASVLVVGHSNTVAPIIAALGGFSLPDLAETDYDRFFQVLLQPGYPPGLVRLRYGQPDTIQASKEASP